MPGFQSRFAEVGGVTAHYYVGGAGPPVVLIHGIGGAATNWTELAPLLARRRRVLVPDLPGHGRSARLPVLDDLAPLAAHVAAVAEVERASPVAVVGHSMGGLVALRLAVSRPDAVSALVLVETAGISSATQRAEVALAFAGVLEPMKRLASLRDVIAGSPRLRRLAFAYWGSDDPAALSPAAVLGLLEGAAGVTDYARAAKAIVKEDPRRQLHLVRSPALLVWGSRDRIVPIADGFEFARRLRAPIRTVAGAGHLLTAERPAECADIIERFLDLHRVGEVDELPVEVELVGKPRGEGLDA